MADAQAQIATKFSQLASVLVGPESCFTPTFWDKTNLHVMDDTVRYQPVRDVTDAFGQKVRFIQPKRATLTTEYLVRCTISAGVLSGAAQTAAYVNNLGDQLLRTVRHRYGNSVIHEYDGEYQQLWQRLTTHEINEESRNALTLGGLPLTPSGENERQRAALTTVQFDVYIPLNRLWFSQHLDEAWMPEAYATNGEIELEFRQLSEVCYGFAGGVAADPFTATKPTISAVELIAREVTLTIPEKMARLSYYEQDRGLLTKFLDVEKQANVTVTGAWNGVGAAPSREVTIKLDNIRLDMQELFFIVRKSGTGWGNLQAAKGVAWSGDPLQAPVYDKSTGTATRVVSQLTGAPANYRPDMLVDGVQIANTDPAVIAYRLEANNRRLFENQFDLLSRTWSRKFYHHDSQAKDPIYHVSFSLFPEESKNVYSFQNAANQGNLTLVLTIADVQTTQTLDVDVWCHSHNLIQSRRGDVVKTLN